MANISAKILVLLQSLALCLPMGFALADEVQDAPLPPPNYFGIIFFVVLMVGGCGWFVWRIMRNKDDKDKK